MDAHLFDVACYTAAAVFALLWFHARANAERHAAEAAVLFAALDYVGRMERSTASDFAKMVVTGDTEGLNRRFPGFARHTVNAIAEDWTL